MTLQPVADAAGVRDLVAAVGQLHVVRAVRRYVVAIVEASRRSPHLRLGASPAPACSSCGPPARRRRCPGATTSCPTTSRSWPPVLAHRLLTADAALGRRSAEQVVAELLSGVPVPRGR